MWEFLCEGRDGIIEVPADRWNNAAVFDPDPGKPGKTPTKWGGFVTDIAEFDAAFFGISPREAAVMDPQQRMLLETAWRALEDAGVQIDKLPGTDTGVFIGISHSDYHGIQKFGRPDIDVHTSTGGALSIAANRLSYRFDLRGPSLSVDTACSSSLVALDLACQAIRNGVVRDGAVRRRQCDPDAGRHRHLQPRLDAVARTDAARRSTRAPTATCAARAPAWWC